MLALDCQSRATTLASVSKIYCVDEGSIDSFLLGLDLERHYEINDPPRSGDEELCRLFEAHFGCHAVGPDRVFWFHLTRTPQGESFAEGLLPLSKSLPKVWAVILHVFQNTEHESRLANMRATGVPGMQYRHKVGQSLHSGPYAMLVRDIAGKSAEVGNHDYLRIPEIMEDICTGYLERYGEDLTEQLSAALNPTVVKFWSARRLGKGCVEAALYYLYKSARHERLSLHANTCFDGEDCIIPPEQIVSIEQPAV